MPQPFMGELTERYAEAVPIVRLAIAAYLLRGMLDTPTHGMTGQASKEAKVKAAFDYADLLLKG